MSGPAGQRPMVTLVELAQWAKGDLVVRSVPSDPRAREAFLVSGITGASLDSRAIEPGMLFVPLPGANVDGHAYLDEAFARGAGAALCARAVHPLIAHHDLGPMIVRARPPPRNWSPPHSRPRLPRCALRATRTTTGACR